MRSRHVMPNRILFFLPTSHARESLCSVLEKKIKTFDPFVVVFRRIRSGRFQIQKIYIRDTRTIRISGDTPVRRVNESFDISGRRKLVKSDPT